MAADFEQSLKLHNVLFGVRSRLTYRALTVLLVFDQEQHSHERA